MDYKEIFKHSNKVVCQNIESYFPGGNIDNRGWYTLKNFDRGENNPGSFGICVSGDRIGAVKDFADDSYNTNITTFYAKINGLKPMEAAKKILKSEDPSFYDKAFPPKSKIKYKAIIPIPEDVYENDFSVFCENDKKISDNIDWIYEYRDIQNNLLYVSIRLKKPFKDTKGKSRKLLAVGYFEHKKNDDKWNDFTWYKQSFAGKAYPFSRQNELSKLGKRNVIIVEGEKAAHFLETVLDLNKWVITCNGGSSNLMNPKSYEIFEKLDIKHVFYWPDNDEPGLKSIGFVKERFDNVSVVKIPDDEYYVDKWDAADAVIDGWSSEDIEKFIFQNLYETEEIDPQYFKALSHDHENFYFMSYRLGLVKPVRQESITLGFLRIMAPREYWCNKYPPTEGMKGLYDTDTAIEDMLTLALKTPYHETGKIRQLGAWEDDGRYVFHYGTGLIVDGQKVGLFDFNTNNIYEKKGYLNFSEDGFKPIDMIKIANIIKRFSISSPQEKYLFLGWIIMSILGGAFDWRPHIWLTGEAGSGKTSAIDFIKTILGSSAIKETGSSTEAGIRQRLKVSTLPVLIDELENMDDKTNKNLRAIKALIRQASSGTRVSRGTADHSGIDFAVQSMFCVGSVSPQIAENADLTRFTLINFDKGLQTSPTHWIETEKMINETLTSDYLNELKYFLVMNTKNIADYVKMAFKVFSDLGFSGRLSQQYSVLTMGSFICLKNGRNITEGGFKEFLSTHFNFNDQIKSGESTEAEYCFSMVLQRIIEYKKSNGLSERLPIFDLLQMYKDEKDNTVNQDKQIMNNIAKSVKPYGFLLEHDKCNNGILFIYNATYVKDILKFTQFSGDIKEILRRHPHVSEIVPETFYAGGRGAAARFSYDILFDKIGQDKKETETLNGNFEDQIPF